MNDSDKKTAAILIIGNEILSGKTSEANVQFIAQELAELGIVLIEARVVRDDTDTIIRHVNECRAQFTYVFTTGGIGPTHDDITAEAIAQAFKTKLVINNEAVQLMGANEAPLSEARLKMARVPVDATLIENPVSRAPGFRIGNVFVLAGVPKIARAMFATIKPQLTPGARIHSQNVDIFLRESDIAGPLAEIASTYKDVEIGSYPFVRDGRPGANLVVRGTDAELVAAVMTQISAAMELARLEYESRSS